MIGEALFRLYRPNNRRWRSLILGLANRLEGGQLYSKTVRRIYKEYYKIEIGLYTNGAIFDLFMIDPYTKIGRFCSVAKGVRIINHNHPLAFKSTSSLFFYPDFGLCDDWLVPFNPLEIGNDVWIGANAVILPEVCRIGDGAVIGAGAVVNRDVPPYAVMLGNPARVVKYRFPEDVIEKLLAEKWWDRDLEDLKKDLAGFQRPFEERSECG